MSSFQSNVSHTDSFQEVEIFAGAIGVSITPSAGSLTLSEHDDKATESGVSNTSITPATGSLILATGESAPDLVIKSVAHTRVLICLDAGEPDIAMCPSTGAMTVTGPPAATYSRLIAYSPASLHKISSSSGRVIFTRHSPVPYITPTPIVGHQPAQALSVNGQDPSLDTGATQIRLSIEGRDLGPPSASMRPSRGVLARRELVRYG